MTDLEVAADIDLADLGDLVERLTKIARANGVAAMSVVHGTLSVDLSLAPLTVPTEQSSARSAEPAIILTSPPSAELTDVITAPMVGTFYTGSKPGEPVFVDAGDRVEIGQTIGIIEAMKIMNEIPSEVDCLVLEVLVTNGQAVEYGTPLFRIVLDAGDEA